MRVIDKSEICDLNYTNNWHFDVATLQKGHTEKVKMRFGRVAVLKLIDCRIVLGKHVWSQWQCIGYDGEKLFEEMSFREFIEVVKRGEI